jgi:hypothetical protein
MKGRSMSRKKKFDPECWAPYCPPPVVLPEEAASAVPALREEAAGMWEEMQWCIGTSLQMVRHVQMPKAFVRLALDWVRHIEMIVRRMIWILALSLKLEPARPRARAAPAMAGFRRRSGHWADVTAWNVTFSMASVKPQRPSRAGARRPPSPVRHFAPTRGLGRRIEALRRALSYHDVHARRFARVLARRAALNTAANAKRLVLFRDWDFHPLRDSQAAHRANDSLRLSTPLANREMTAWQKRWIEPG